MFNSSDNRKGFIGPIFLAYFILVLHLLLIAGLGLLVLFFRGIVAYMAWIFLGGMLVICIGCFLFYRRMKAEGRNLRDMIESPLFNGRSVEISLLGGLASFRIGAPADSRPMIIHEGNMPPGPGNQLEDPGVDRIKELDKLVSLLENNLITPDEYDRAKRHLFEP